MRSYELHCKYVVSNNEPSECCVKKKNVFCLHWEHVETFSWKAGFQNSMECFLVKYARSTWETQRVSILENYIACLTNEANLVGRASQKSNTNFLTLTRNLVRTVDLKIVLCESRKPGQFCYAVKIFVFVTFWRVMSILAFIAFIKQSKTNKQMDLEKWFNLLERSIVSVLSGCRTPIAFDL